MKKQWISVKCGLSRDPKHRQRMGESVWLFLHMLDRADWESGKVLEWKDEAEAEEMDMPVRTLREHRRKLEELDYITCIQKQYGQEITIHNWTNPREYSGAVTNKKQGGKEPSPEEQEQGYTQGYTQGSRKDVIPTSNSNIKESSGDKSPKQTNELPIEWQIAGGVKDVVLPDQKQARMRDTAQLIGMGEKYGAADLALAFMQARDIIIPEGKIKGQRKAVREMLEMGVRSEHITEAVQQLLIKGMTVIDLFSVSKTAQDLANKKEIYTGDKKQHGL